MLYSSPSRGGGGGGVELEESLLNILCTQCEHSRFYMITEFEEIEQILAKIRACDRAIVKILRARANEHSYKFCEQIEQTPNFASS